LAIDQLDDDDTKPLAIEVVNLFDDDDTKPLAMKLGTKT
jgi:hypothetical protein